MVQREFKTNKDWLHLPIRCGAAENGRYIEIYADGIFQCETFAEIAPLGEDANFYAGLYIGKYDSQNITLICRDEDAPEALFDGVIPGARIQDEPALYPDLYSEPSRQQIHFSPARGWMNDLNGLFFKDGLFNIYFQHNPLSNHHFNSIISWGHATSGDGVHFTEYHDAITPRNSKYLVASGSATVDKNNLSGYGKDAILAAYTDLNAVQYRGRPKVTEGCGQCLMVSTDGGMNFCDIRSGATPIIPSYIIPKKGAWRDPKLLSLDDGSLCIGVYETYGEQNCISFYSSNDTVNWTLRSRSFDMYECPDLFPLETEDGEHRWVLYGGNGKYLVGSFENFEFTPEGDGGWIDYGAALYAGQTVNGYPDPRIRMHGAWMKDGYDCYCATYDPNRKQPFYHSMSLLCELTLNKTPYGLRIFRRPRKELEKLRKGEAQIFSLDTPISLSTPCEVRFSLTDSASVSIAGEGFSWDRSTGLLTGWKGKEITLSARDRLDVIAYTDRRSVEFFVGSEVSLSFSVQPDAYPLSVVGEATDASVWALESIWKK